MKWYEIHKETHFFSGSKWLTCSITDFAVSVLRLDKIHPDYAN